MNPWKDLVTITICILDEAHVGRADTLPGRVLKLAHDLKLAEENGLALATENSKLKAEVERLTPKREPVPPPPSYNDRTIQEVEKQEGRRK